MTEKLEQQGKMTNTGRIKIEDAKKNGQWSAQKSQAITKEQVSFLSGLLEKYEPAHSHFLKMSPSVKKTYARAYYDAKTDDGRAKRISWMVERLNKNLKPM